MRRIYFLMFPGFIVAGVNSLGYGRMGERG